MITTDLDTVVARGSHPPVGSDVLPRNVWVVKPVVQGRKEATDVPCNQKLPRDLSLPKEPLPHGFYVQLDMDDMHKLVIPPAFQKALKVFLKFSLPTCIGMSVCRWCQEWVSVTEFGGQIVLGRGWRDFALNHDLQYNDILVFTLKEFSLQVKIYKVETSTVMAYICPHHA